MSWVTCNRCHVEYSEGSVHKPTACARELVLEALGGAEELSASLSKIVGADDDDRELASLLVSTLEDARAVLGGDS